MTNFSIDLVKVIDDTIFTYSQDKEAYDSKLQEAVEFDYSAIDEFEEGGNKVPLMLQHSAIFVDCSYLQKDAEEILRSLSLMLRQEQEILY